MINSKDKVESNGKYSNDLGEILKRKREELNLSVNCISDKLKVKQKDIAAIETGELSKVSSNLYLLGIISEYAKIVGVDKQIIVKNNQDLNLKSKDSKQFKIRSKVDGNQSHSPEREVFVVSAVLSIIIILIILFYYNYTIKTSHDQVRDSIKSHGLK